MIINSLVVACNLLNLNIIGGERVGQEVLQVHGMEKGQVTGSKVPLFEERIYVDVLKITIIGIRSA